MADGGTAIAATFVFEPGDVRFRPIGTVDPRAVIADTARLGRDVVVHPFAIIGRVPDRSAALARQPVTGPAGTDIGDRTVVGPHAIVYGQVAIGPDCLVGDGASIREGTRIGARCVIGRGVTIGYDVTIGDDVRLNDGVHITGGTVVGAGCFFGPGVMTSNDRRIDLRDYGFHGVTPPIFGARVFVGTSANILAGTVIGDDVVIGAGALVVRDLPSGHRALGHPSRNGPRP